MRASWWHGRGRGARTLPALAVALRELSLFFVALLAALFAATASAQVDTAQTRGLDWLAAQVAADGSLTGEASAPAQALQTRTEAVRTLIGLGRPAPATLVQALQTQTPPDAELIARVAHALRAAGADAAAAENAMLALQRADGGVAAHAQAASTVLDTAWALRALAARTVQADIAVNWLRARQSASGLWEAAPRSPLVTTATTLRALLDAVPRNATATTAAAQAATALISARRADGLWQDSVWVNALVFEAVHPYLGNDESARNQVRDALLAAQAGDGSWGDPYTTALALRALRLSTQAPSNPTTGIVRGRVVDASSAAPMQGVAVSLDEQTTGIVTDTNGAFELRDVLAGNRSLVLGLVSYELVRAQLTVPAGQTVDLGTISMVRSTGANTGVIRGQVADASTGQPISSATVRIDNGAITTSTALDGSYFIANAALGSHTIAVSAGGYQDAAGSGAIAAGETLLFSPRLVRSGAQPPAGDGVLVQGTVVHAGTGAPIAGAAVSVVLLGADASGQTLTDANGRFAFTSIPRTQATTGVVAVGVQLDGYVALTLTTTMPTDVGTLRMVPTDPRRLLPDLFPANLKKSNVLTDAQRNSIDGYVTFDVVNFGLTPAPSGVTYTAFEDRNRNGRFDADLDLVLGTVQHQLGLQPSATAQLRIDVAGQVVFRDNQILVAADSDNRVIESDEDNNVARCECFYGLPYVEDFDDGVADGVRYIGNQAGQTTTWTVANGHLEATGGGGALLGRPEWTDYDAEVKVMFPFGAGNDAALVFRASADNYWYHFRFKSGHARLLSSLGGGYTVPREVPFSVESNRWYTLKVKVRGAMVEAFIDDAFVLSYDNLQIPAGRVGVMKDGGVTARYDDLRVFGGAVASFSDLSASYVRVTDGGTSGVSRVAVRVGNGGTRAVGSGVRVALYRGTPSAGNLVRVVQTSVSLSQGEYEDVAFDITGGLAGLGQITIVVDDDGSGAGRESECDESNNSISADLGQLTAGAALTVAAATDKPLYTELDVALVSAGVSNTGSMSKDAQVRFTIESSDGQPVQVLALPASIAVAASAQGSASGTWPVAGVLAGNYRVRAELIDSAGMVYASALAPFAVEASNTAFVGSRLTADRVQYTAAQTVNLRSRVLNATANMVVDDLVATTVIRNAAGAEVWRRAEPPLQLSPRGAREYSYGVPANTLAAGEYNAELQVRDALGNLRSSSALHFTVLGTDQSGIGLRASLDVPASLAIGQSAALAYTLTNGGNAALSNVPLTLRIVDPVAGTLRGQFALQANVEPGAVQTASVTWQATGNVGDVVAVLVAVINGREQVLAQAPFKLTQPQVQIDLGIVAKTERDARVLVLVSCPVNNGQDDPTCVQQRSAAIAAALSAQGVSHRIVSTAAEFAAEQRCGAYNTYWISGGAAKLSADQVKELREAVRRGDGLIVEGVHDSRNLLLHPVAGVKQIGKLPGQNYSAQVAAGNAFPAGPLATLGQPTRFELTSGQALAQYDGGVPAIVVNRYGEGTSVLLAFDYGAMVQAGPTGSTAQALLDAELELTANSRAQWTGGDIARLTTEGTNRAAQAVDVEVRAQLPQGITLVDSLPPATQVSTNATGTEVTWRSTLTADATLPLTLRVRTTNAAASSSYDIAVSVYSVAGSTTQHQGSVTHTLTLTPRTSLSQAAQAALNALAPTKATDQAALRKAVDAATLATQRSAQGDAIGAIEQWIAAADWIASITSEDVATLAAAQLALARAIEASADAACGP